MEREEAIEIAQGIKKRIREKRMNMGITQMEVARRLGIKGPTYQMVYEQESNQAPRVISLIRVANALNCSVSSLIGEHARNIVIEKRFEKIFSHLRCLRPEALDAISLIIEDLAKGARR